MKEKANMPPEPQPEETPMDPFEDLDSAANAAVGVEPDPEPEPEPEPAPQSDEEDDR